MGNSKISKPVLDDDERKQNLAATIIQKYYRGYLDRKKHRKPETQASHYPSFVYGNDPEISFTSKEKRSDGRFVLIGCSGMRSLMLVKEIINFNNFFGSEFSMDDKFFEKNTPKLFIIDNSGKVQLFWKYLKEAFQKSDDLKSLEQAVCDLQSKFQECSDRNPRPDGIAQEVRAVIQKLCNNEDEYKFFKEVVAKAVFIRSDWQNQKAFDYVKSHTADQQKYVYVSNIVEYVAYCDQEKTDDERMEPVRQVMQAVCSVEPHMVLHTRSSFAYQQDGIMLPTCVEKLNSKDPKEHIKRLSRAPYGELPQNSKSADNRKYFGFREEGIGSKEYATSKAKNVDELLQEIQKQYHEAEEEMRKSPNQALPENRESLEKFYNSIHTKFLVHNSQKKLQVAIAKIEYMIGSLYFREGDLNNALGYTKLAKQTKEKVGEAHLVEDSKIKKIEDEILKLSPQSGPAKS